MKVIRNNLVIGFVGVLLVSAGINDAMAREEHHRHSDHRHSDHRHSDHRHSDHRHSDHRHSDHRHSDHHHSHDRAILAVPRGNNDPEGIQEVDTIKSAPNGTYKTFNPVYSYGIHGNKQGSPGILRYVTKSGETLLVTVDRTHNQVHFWRRDVSTGAMYLLSDRTQSRKCGGHHFNRPWSIMGADFNRDGVKDIVVQVDRGACVFYMGDSGKVQSSYFVKSPYHKGLIFMTPADFNGDGYPDLVSVGAEAILRRDSDDEYEANKGGYYSDVILFTNNGNGHFHKKQVIRLSEHDSSAPEKYIGGRPVLNDLDGDGDMDLVVATFTAPGKHIPSPVFVVENKGGEFEAKSVVTVNGNDLNPSGAVIADYNQDGYQDIIVANYLGKSVDIFYGDGTVNGFAKISPTELVGGNANNGLVIHDMNNDGRPDIVVANANPSNPSVEIFYNGKSSSETLGAGFNLFSRSSHTMAYSDTNYNYGTFPLDVRVFDWDQNGLPDIIAANYAVKIKKGEGAYTETSSFTVVLQSY